MNPPATDTNTGRVATRSVNIPYTNKYWARLEASFPMNETEWSQMMAVLNAMKPGLVSSEDKTKDA